MKKICLVFLFPILILNASFGELLKAPRLISHFLHHHKINSNVGVLDFLEMHYLGKDIDDNDQDEDMKLPFKKIDGSHSLSLAIPQSRVVLQDAEYRDLYTRSPFKYYFAFSEPAFGSLFRPPIA